MKIELELIPGEPTLEQKEHDFYVYRCSSFKLKEGAKCSGGRVRAKDLEEVVWLKVIQIFRKPAVIRAEVVRILEEMPTAQLENDLTAAQGQIDKKRRLRDALLTKWEVALADADYELSETLDAKVNTVSDDIKALQAIINDLQTRVKESCSRSSCPICQVLPESYNWFR